MILNAAHGKCGFIGEGNESSIDYHFILGFYILYYIYYINIINKIFFITLPGVKLILNAARGKCGFIGEGNESSIDYHFILGLHIILNIYYKYIKYITLIYFS